MSRDPHASASARQPLLHRIGRVLRRRGGTGESWRRDHDGILYADMAGVGRMRILPVAADGTRRYVVKGTQGTLIATPSLDPRRDTHAKRAVERAAREMRAVAPRPADARAGL